ncbi:unnamed protein product [Euphydryas editha]|uniref:Uncharacterized protein n=1 Tax=Euphydryas editha TaxID=104508 RepID=A0AAU9UEW2_EUPED|nr:unnamed protein product [Euphydryas editha]
MGYRRKAETQEEDEGFWARRRCGCKQDSTAAEEEETLKAQNQASRTPAANINHCVRAQDLLMQSVVQREIDLVVASEPYWVPRQPNWFGDLDGTVAVILGNAAGPSLSLVDRGADLKISKCIRDLNDV